jgi:hypothetical protein
MCAKLKQNARHHAGGHAFGNKGHQFVEIA